jgi:hypothetical protein
MSNTPGGVVSGGTSTTTVIGVPRAAGGIGKKGLCFAA